MRTAPAMLIGFAAWSLAAVALGQAPPNELSGGRRWREVRALDGGDALVAVDTEWTARGTTGARNGHVALRRLGGPPRELPLTVYDGQAPQTCLAIRGQTLLVGLVSPSPRPLVRVVLVDVSGRPHVVHQTDLPRRALPQIGFPTNIVCASDPSGFSVLWQEQGDSAANVVTALARLDEHGSIREQPHVVPIPWGVAAMAWNGHGYHLALYFGGFGGAGQEGEQRVCLVTLREAGTPEQHPWWISPMEIVSDVQMLASPEGAIDVTWRSGNPSAEHIAHQHVTAVASWGSEPLAAHDLGAITPEEPYALHRDANGDAVTLRGQSLGEQDRTIRAALSRAPR